MKIKRSIFMTSSLLIDQEGLSLVPGGLCLIFGVHAGFSKIDEMLVMSYRYVENQP